VRIESSVSSLSWIPQDAVTGLPRLAFDAGVAHYDPPPPDVLTDLDELRKGDRFRFANELRAWVEVADGRIVRCGQSGHGHINVTKVGVGRFGVVFPPTAFPDRRTAENLSPASVRFVQTAGGRTGAPVPRRVPRPPYFQISAPIAWTTLGLTISADGTSTHEVLGASAFPRHWVYDAEGQLVAKTGFIDAESWFAHSFGTRTPWGEEDSPAIVTAAETALERELSVLIMDSRPEFRRLAEGQALVNQGDPGNEIFLLFDGVLRVEVNGEPVTEVGPGALLGELAVLAGGRRRATLRAVTPCRIAVVPGDRLDRKALEELAGRWQLAEETDF